MKSEQILARPPLVLSQEQREFYFENGYLLSEDFVSREWLDRLWEVSNAFIERSRELITESNTMLALETTHSAENPRLRRLIDPSEHHPLYWEYVSQGPLADVAEDLLGPAFHEGRMIRGQPARWVEFDADACQLPPDRSNQPGVTIFSAQNREHSV